MSAEYNRVLHWLHKTNTFLKGFLVICLSGVRVFGVDKNLPFETIVLCTLFSWFECCDTLFGWFEVKHFDKNELDYLFYQTSKKFLRANATPAPFNILCCSNFETKLSTVSNTYSLSKYWQIIMPQRSLQTTRKNLFRWDVITSVGVCFPVNPFISSLETWEMAMFLFRSVQNQETWNVR